MKQPCCGSPRDTSEIPPGTTRRRGTMADPEWASFPDDKLLAMRMCDLGLVLGGTDIEPLIAQIDGELDARGLVRPHYWLSDEWFTPDGVPGIAIPFYLAHPRLAKLELAQML